MKSDYREPQNPQVKPDAATSGPRQGTDYGSNTIDVGSVGLESGDNGASTLRELRKKHANDANMKKASSRKPML